MDNHVSGCKEQRSGIKQECTLNSLLLIRLQTIFFDDIELAYLNKDPFLVIPQIPFFEIKFANATVV